MKVYAVSVDQNYGNYQVVAVYQKESDAIMKKQELVSLNKTFESHIEIEEWDVCDTY